MTGLHRIFYVRWRVTLKSETYCKQNNIFLVKIRLLLVIFFMGIYCCLVMKNVCILKEINFHFLSHQFVIILSFKLFFIFLQLSCMIMPICLIISTWKFMLYGNWTVDSNQFFFLLWILHFKNKIVIKSDFYRGFLD